MVQMAYKHNNEKAQGHVHDDNTCWRAFGGAGILSVRRVKLILTLFFTSSAM
jgi:hypothetical protein